MTIRPGGPQVNVQQLMAAGQSDFAQSSSMRTLNAMTDVRWETFFKEMAASGALAATFDYRKAYTRQFVKDL